MGGLYTESSQWGLPLEGEVWADWKDMREQVLHGSEVGERLPRLMLVSETLREEQQASTWGRYGAWGSGAASAPG